MVRLEIRSTELGKDKVTYIQIVINASIDCFKSSLIYVKSLLRLQHFFGFKNIFQIAKKFQKEIIMTTNYNLHFRECFTI